MPGLDDTTITFTGNSPVVSGGDIVTFLLSIGPGVERALCAVVQGDTVLEETDCERKWSTNTGIILKWCFL